MTDRTELTPLEQQVWAATYAVMFASDTDRCGLPLRAKRAMRLADTAVVQLRLLRAEDSAVGECV